MEAKKVLFICVHNSGRSQMAQAYLNHLANGRYIAESAGLEKSPINPFVVKAMEEVGLDVSSSSTNLVFDYFKEGRIYHYVIKVCDEASAEKCPIFPDILGSYHWNIQDPATLKGTDREVLQGIREIREEIKQLVTDWLKSH